MWPEVPFLKVVLASVWTGHQTEGGCAQEDAGQEPRLVTTRLMKSRRLPGRVSADNAARAPATARRPCQANLRGWPGVFPTSSSHHAASRN